MQMDILIVLFHISGEEPMRKMPVSKFTSRPSIWTGTLCKWRKQWQWNRRNWRKRKREGAQEGWDWMTQDKGTRSSARIMVTVATAPLPPWAPLRPGGTVMILGLSTEARTWPRAAQVGLLWQQRVHPELHGQSAGRSTPLDMRRILPRQSDSFSQAGRVMDTEVSGRAGSWDSGRRGLGFGHQDRPTSSKAFSRVYDGPSRGGSGLLPTPSLPSSILASTIDENRGWLQSIIGRCRYPERSCVHEWTRHAKLQFHTQSQHSGLQDKPRVYLC